MPLVGKKYCWIFQTRKQEKTKQNIASQKKQSIVNRVTHN